MLGENHSLSLTIIDLYCCKTFPLLKPVIRPVFLFFLHTEEFVFPKEKDGQPDTIIKNITEAENTDENLDGYTFLVKKSTEYYSWDGKNFKLIKTKKLKPYIEKED